MKTNFLVKKDNKVYFKGGKLEIFIPKDFFDEDLAEEQGLTILTFGTFIMKYYRDKDSKSFTKYQLSLPEDLKFSYTETYDVNERLIEKEVDDELDNNDTSLNLNDEDLDDEDKIPSYKVFVLYDNDVFIENTSMPKSYQNVSKLVNLHQKGSIPESIRYSDILSLYLECMYSNSTDLQVPGVILEVIVSELARYKRNTEIPFRQVIGKNNSKVSEYDYKQISDKELAMINSTFTAISSENMTKAVVYSVDKSRTDGKESETPIEPTIKY